MTNYTKGQRVSVVYKRKEFEAQVVLASPNGRSLMLHFEGMAGGFIMMLPVTRDDNGFYYDLFEHEPVLIAPL
jgi:hypothetical protein